ncbi:glutamyl-tRNA reductase [Haloarcula onubensis]|uniref:Glutamyl-tRNA reductase n=1 Tax=Haloarcula onubensis TaxID=2950539 RepID=A0ABU2FRM0_9EURY|nr:glutamyl-tRNA reductase [Halomicroarcula sp. S3CR25-11]MDS0282892.1 glutamyl-tRNA reductase [Halomicroarcula sp. S3CR25-11]
MAVQEETEPDSVARARDRLDREAEAVRTEQLERALSRLGERGELTPAQRAAVERLSERLVEGVFAGPRERLREPSNGTAAARTVLELFD